VSCPRTQQNESGHALNPDCSIWSPALSLLDHFAFTPTHNLFQYLGRASEKKRKKE